jgi:glycosyltransferase involved in cell wall biosynthesis
LTKQNCPKGNDKWMQARRLRYTLMRICIVTGIFPPDIGGPASYVALLAESLHSVGWKVEVVTYSSATAAPRGLFPVHRISRALPLAVRLVLTITQVLRSGTRSDLIYCNGLVVPTTLASLLLRKPLVIKIEGDCAWERASNRGWTTDPIEGFQRRRQRCPVTALKRLRDWCLKRCCAVITTSQFLGRLIRRWGYAGPLHVISNAIEEDFGAEVANLSRAECKVRIGYPDRNIVVSVGRFVRWKGFAAVIRAAESLPDNTVVLIAGEGPERLRLTHLIVSAGLREKVFLVGKVSRTDLPLYLKAADCFVLNSGYESFSHVTLEAMKMGTAVVAARTTGMPELVEHERNGLLFEKDDVSRMVACMKTCLGDWASRERVTAEAARRLSDYSWQRTFPRTVKVLEGAARRHR